jgi:hypothetical protein
VVVGYTDSGLSAYDCREAAGYSLSLPQKLGAPWLLGYSHSQATWAGICEGDLLSPEYKLLLINPNRSTVICSGDLSLFSSALCNDVLYVPAHAQGRLSLKRYTLDGKQIESVSLDIDDVAPRFTIDVAPNGSIAAGLVKRGASEEPHIYLFGSDGKLKARVASGGNPRFGGDGRYLAYRHNGHITILDLKTKRERSICNAKPGCSCNRDHESFDMREYQLSPDGQALICSYVQGWPVRTAAQSVYVVDLSDDTPQWHKLPIQVLHGWVVLDRVPNPFVREKL